MGQKQRWASGGLALGIAATFVLARPAPRIPDQHGEYIKYLSGGDSITAYIVYPERSDAAPAIVVIHEIFGLTDFVRNAAERLAREGYVVIAPDLLSRRGGTPPSADSARRLIATLNTDTIMRDLDGAVDLLQSLRSVRAGSIGVIGFCWGGGESFLYAAHNHKLATFVVCYGPTPKYDDIMWLRTPGFGVYADKDARITQTLQDLSVVIDQNHIPYKFKVYPNVGHGFLRTREDPKMADQAWTDIYHFFQAQFGGNFERRPTYMPPGAAPPR
ncbi:MAG TPA: dienelactone hydrolase family protein [Gemmatimonadales bacterium]|nr:dienelactone hydrolase family protein [Gemmatimonadales bacterium]